MPEFTRYFPVTHDINADPELWELRGQFGDRAGFVWLEILSIADRNQGLVGPESDSTRDQLAAKCRTNRVKVGLILGWCWAKGWIRSDQGLRVVNWAKYHRRRSATRQITSNKLAPSEPNLTEPNLTEPPIAPQKKEAAQPDGFAEFWLAYPRKVAKAAAEKAWKKLKPPSPTILAAIEKQKKQESWTKEGGQFIPYPATWLNQKRWEDEIIVSPLAAKRKSNEIDHGDNKSAIGWIAPGSFRIFESQKGKVDNPIPIGKIIESLDLKSKKE